MRARDVASVDLGREEYMAASRQQFAFFCAVLVLVPVFTSCSSGGPQPPKPGTPAFYWAAAKETYRTGDFVKTNDNLGQISKTDNEFTARARLWEIVTSSGLAQAYIELADVYDAGAKARRDNPTPFRREASTLRTSASAAALEFADAFHRFQEANKDPKVTLEFDFPGGNAAQPAELKKISSGIFLQESEAALVQKAMGQRGVLRSACRAVGAPEDAPKAAEIYKPGKAEVSSEVFRMQMATLLHEQAQLFGPTKLDQPQRVKLLCGEALEAIKAVPPSKQTKELTTKIQATLKKSRVS